MLNPYLSSDENSPFNIRINNFRKEADGLSSVRGPEAVSIKQDILSALGHRSEKKSSANKPPGRGREKQQTSLQSSDSSGNESRQAWAARKKKRSRQVPRGTQQSLSENSIPQRPIWLALVKMKLSALIEWTQVVPIELRLLRQLSYESIDTREDSIRDAESGTFSWMLDDETTADLLPHMDYARNSFIEWLNSGSGVFHISGNAGAGMLLQ
jgi:hypothetical protein